MNEPIAEAWDCHAHVIGDPGRYPLYSGRSYDPPPAPLDAYLALLDRHGITRGVLVQPSVYGFDNRCLLDALERAEGQLRGVVVLDPAKSHDLERLHRRGVRAIRCNLLNPGAVAPAQMRDWIPAMRDLGWHVEVHADVDQLGDLLTFIHGVGVPVVIDHMGRPAPGSANPATPSLHALIALVREGVCHVKLSAPYRLSAEPPPWSDVAPLARALVAGNPGRCVWATDWPHTSTPTTISERDLFAALDAWCPDEATRRRLLEVTPNALYGTP